MLSRPFYRSLTRLSQSSKMRSSTSFSMFRPPFFNIPLFYAAARPEMTALFYLFS